MSNENSESGCDNHGMYLSNLDNVQIDVSNEISLEPVELKPVKFKERNLNLIIIIAFLFLTFILAIAVLVVSILYSTEKSEKICLSKECVRTAADFILSMNTSVDPCDDFYQYSCGNWAENRINPERYTQFDPYVISTLQFEKEIMAILAKNNSENEPLPVHQARDMYKACMDVDSIKLLKMKPVLDLMRDIGLNVLPREFNLTKSYNSTLDWIGIMVRLKKIAGINMLIQFSIENNIFNNSAQAMVFQMAEMTSLSFRDSLIHEITEEFMFNKFEAVDLKVDMKDNETNVIEMELMMNVAKLMIDSIPKSKKLNKSEKIITDTIKAKYLDFLDMWREIKEILSRYKEDKDQVIKDSDIIFLTADELQKQTDDVMINYNLPTVNFWRTFILTMFNDTNTTIDFKTDKIMSHRLEIKQMHEILAIIQNTTISKLENFLWFNILETFAKYTFLIIEETTPLRSESCISNIIENMKMAISYAVLSKNNQSSQISNLYTPAKNMLVNIRKSLKDMIGDLDWMDDVTKAIAIEKIQNTKDFIGYPDWLLNPESLEKYYEGLVVRPNTYILNEIMLSGLKFRKKLNNFIDTRIENWIDHLTTFNAYHVPTTNSIVIPYVMLQYHFHDLGLEALNYGALGFVLGHELTHGIDDIGRKYDKYGNKISNLWSNLTIQRFTKRASCLQDQFSKFYISELDEYVNGNLTLNENIADDGGLKAAKLAYWSIKNEQRLPGLSNINNEQLFFLSFAISNCNLISTEILKLHLEDEHPPNHLRVNANLMNNPEFARVWNCPVGSKMNPFRDRCSIY